MGAGHHHHRPTLRTSLRLDEEQCGTLEVLLKVMRPPVALVVFGAGQDALPVVEMAHAIGWRTELGRSDRRAEQGGPAGRPRVLSALRSV